MKNEIGWEWYLRPTWPFLETRHTANGFNSNKPTTRTVYSNRVMVLVCYAVQYNVESIDRLPTLPGK